jgi:hypothetical protein
MLHYYLRVYFYGFILCVVFLAYVACIYLLSFCMNMCNYSMYLYVYVLYIISARVLCVYVLIACSSKSVGGIAQLDVGYVTLCSAERMKELSHVLWPGLGGRGHYTGPYQIDKCYDNGSTKIRTIDEEQFPLSFNGHRLKLRRSYYEKRKLLL